MAVYWAPAREDPLLAAGNGWLGWDPDVCARVAQPAVAGLQEMTAAARVYGFHATLRAPMRLSTGWEEFSGAMRRLAAGFAPFEMPALAVQDIGGFLALGLAAPCPALQDLADACVMGTDLHRLALGAEELGRRRRTGLSAVEDALLVRWGYPHVMQAWRFHMTLSRRLDADEMQVILPLARAHFRAALGVRRRVFEVAVFTQVEGGVFREAGRVRLGD